MRRGLNERVTPFTCWRVSGEHEKWADGARGTILSARFPYYHFTAAVRASWGEMSDGHLGENNFLFTSESVGEGHPGTFYTSASIPSVSKGFVDTLFFFFFASVCYALFLTTQTNYATRCLTPFSMPVLNRTPTAKLHAVSIFASNLTRARPLLIDKYRVRLHEGSLMRVSSRPL